LHLIKILRACLRAKVREGNGSWKTPTIGNEEKKGARGGPGNPALEKRGGKGHAWEKKVVDQGGGGGVFLGRGGYRSRASLKGIRKRLWRRYLGERQTWRKKKKVQMGGVKQIKTRPAPRSARGGGGCIESKRCLANVTRKSREERKPNLKWGTKKHLWGHRGGRQPGGEGGGGGGEFHVTACLGKGVPPLGSPKREGGNLFC